MLFCFGEVEKFEGPVYPTEFRLKVVRLFLEEGYSASLLAEQFGISRSAIRRWIRLYQQRGIEGLEIKPRAGGNTRTRVPPEVRERMLAVKQAHPEYGSRRIADVLKRFFRKAETCCVSWLRPNLAWAVDDCRKNDTAVPGTLHLHNLTDLCSRYKPPSIASSSLPCGEEVAGHLAYLFDRFGPPLFCKRDNGGNLNHSAVNEVLKNAWVIPINNPPITPSYNGAVERTQREFKGFVKRWRWKATKLESYFLLSETAAHELNHTPRRSLDNRTACGTYFGGNRIRYSKRERKSIFRWILSLAAKITIRSGKPKITNAEWRIAAKQWLLKNGLIKIVRAGKVSPH